MNDWGLDLYICPLCGRKHPQQNMSWHHLLPRLGKSEKEEPRIYICRTCHDVIHFCHTNRELRELYNTLENILKSELINKYINLYKNKNNSKIYKIKKLKLLFKESYD
jgi:DNA repair exonuclease SbcCD ATPase subunit